VGPEAAQRRLSLPVGRKLADEIRAAAAVAGDHLANGVIVEQTGAGQHPIQILARACGIRRRKLVRWRRVS
jgi:hypothetical protein